MSRDRVHMAAIGREGGESRSAAAREARQTLASEREVPMHVSREGDRRESTPADRPRTGVVPRLDESTAR